MSNMPDAWVPEPENKRCPSIKNIFGKEKFQKVQERSDNYSVDYRNVNVRTPFACWNTVVITV